MSEYVFASFFRQQELREGTNSQLESCLGESRSDKIQHIIDQALSGMTIPEKGSIRLSTVHAPGSPHAKRFQIAGVPANPAKPQEPLMLLYGLGDPRMVLKPLNELTVLSPFCCLAPPAQGKLAFVLNC